MLEAFRRQPDRGLELMGNRLSHSVRRLSCHTRPVRTSQASGLRVSLALVLLIGSQGAALADGERGELGIPADGRIVPFDWIESAEGIEWTEYWVDPLFGEDASGNGRSRRDPLRTVSWVLANAQEPNVRVRLDDHVYGAGRLRVNSPGLRDRNGDPLDEQIPVEVFPLTPSATIERLSIESANTSVVDLVSVDLEATILRSLPSISEPAQPAAEPGEEPALAVSRLRFLELRNIRLVGARTGLLVGTADDRFDGDSARTVQVVLDNVWCADIHGATVQVSATAGRELALIADDGYFDECTTAFAIHTGLEGRLQAAIRGLVVRALREPALPGIIFGAGVDLAAGEASELAVLCDRVIVENVPLAFGLATAGPGARPSRSEVLIRNSVVTTSSEHGKWDCANGESSSEFSCRSHIGARVAAFEGHQVDLRIINNTFLGLTDAGLLVENSPAEDDLGSDELALELRNNIFWHENREVGPDSTTKLSNVRLGEIPQVICTYNILPEAWRSEDAALHPSNLAVDPRVDVEIEVEEDWFAEYQSHFRLLPGSPAIDAGDPATELAWVGDSDLSGGCRIATSESVLARDGQLRIDIGAQEFGGVCESEFARRFLRGDCRTDSRVELSDAIYLFGFSFLGGARPSCFDACDANDDGALDITDGVYVLGYLFLGSTPPAPPFPARGEDPTPDELPDCAYRL